MMKGGEWQVDLLPVACTCELISILAERLGYFIKKRCQERGDEKPYIFTSTLPRMTYQSFVVIYGRV